MSDEYAKQVIKISGVFGIFSVKQILKKKKIKTLNFLCCINHISQS